MRNKRQGLLQLTVTAPAAGDVVAPYSADELHVPASSFCLKNKHYYWRGTEVCQ